MRRTTLAILILGLVPALALTSPALAQPDDDDDAEEGDDDDDDGEAGAPAPPVATPPPADALDLDALRAEYLKLRDELFRSRARAAAVASALYSSKIQIRLEYGAARYYTVDRASIRLDGASVFDDTDGAITKDKAPRFEGYIAPGRHTLSFKVAATGKDDQRFTSIIENTMIVQAVAGSDLVITARATDGGDIPYNWNRKSRGSYKLHLDVDIEAVKRSNEKKVAQKK